ncbi:thioredoxin family protein [Taibaiella koreensis]|uniref:thioredoxin family protein n=1 Tax=Taibaiella koreensis TaxID=1268548 RepID=UPI000E59FC80|nr:thioredoxin family protein [Taibaiella koreensis]
MTIFDTAKQHYSYAEFVQLLETLMAEGKTTGPNQSDDYLFYARLNLQRMRRWDKTFELREDVLSAMSNVVTQDWWVITEGWCGDSAQNLPAIARMAEAAKGKITLRIVLRDENPQIMDQYLTNGTSRSIPILVAFDGNGNQLFRWGPRPVTAQALLTAWKSNPAPVSFEEFEKEMHTWYALNKGKAVQDELMQLLQN